VGSVEGFSVLAVIEIVDRATRTAERIDASFDKFASTAARAAEVAGVAGEKIDASLLQTASGANAMELADAKLSAAQSRVASTAEQQATAERALLEAQSQAAAAEDGDTAATERLVAASRALTDAQKQSALAAKEAGAAQEHQASVQRATAAASGESAAATDAAAASTTRAGASAERAAAGGSLMSKGMGMAGLAVAAVGVLAIKAAGNFESMTEHLVTDAGESQSGLAKIRAGMLQIAADTGTTTSQMAAGMYHVESAGFHAANGGLDVMRVAAEGAKVGGADLDTVSKALTGTMNAYGMSGDKANVMMNEMITTVGQGDMKMQDLAASLGNVAPLAAAVHIKFSEVGGALATMTAQNMSAQQATQDLAFTIRDLTNPLGPARSEMQALGLSVNGVTQELGSKGLVATLETVTNALAAHTKGGQVFISSLKDSKVAAADLNVMMGQLSPSIQGTAKALQAGTITAKQYNKDLSGLSLPQKALAQQFEALVKKSSSFNDLLKSGSPQAQAMTAALSKLMGGSTGLNTALMITGGRMDTFKNGAKAIEESATKGGKGVDNWAAIQGTFNQKLDVAKASIEAAGISLGTVLLPPVSAIAGAIAKVVVPMATWIAHNQKIVGLLLAVAGAIGAVVLAMKAWEIVQGVMNALALIFAGAEAAILSPAELIVIAIAAVVAGVVYAYFHFKVFRDVVNAVADAVRIAFFAMWHALEAAWRAIAAAAVAVGHALAAAWGAVVGAAEAVWHALEAAWNAVASVTTTVWNAISGFFAKWWPLLLMIFLPAVAAVIGIWNHFHTQIIGTAKAVWGAVAGFFVATWHVIEAGARLAWNAIKVTIIQPIQATWSAIQPIIHAIESFLAAIWRGIQATASAVWNGIKAAIINPITGAWHAVVSVVGNIGSAIGSGLQSAWNAVSNIGSKFLSIGSDIVNGIVSGIEGAASWLFNSVGDLAKNALKSAMSALGINSPSKVFADGVGMAIPEGIAKGVNDHAHLAHAAVRNLSGALPGSAQTALTGSLSLAGAGAGLSYGGGAGGGGGTLVVHNHFEGAHFSSKADMDRLINDIGRSLATKMLPQGGYRSRG
jgi:TP901 family phage tail tape measure protein